MIPNLNSPKSIPVFLEWLTGLKFGFEIQIISLNLLGHFLYFQFWCWLTSFYSKCYYTLGLYCWVLWRLEAVEIGSVGLNAIRFVRLILFHLRIGLLKSLLLALNCFGAFLLFCFLLFFFHFLCLGEFEFLLDPCQYLDLLSTRLLESSLSGESLLEYWIRAQIVQASKRGHFGGEIVKNHYLLRNHLS